MKKVNFTATASAEQIATLKLLPELRSVGLYRGTVDDDSLSHLTQTSLEELDLQRSTVLAQLLSLQNLKTLELREVRVGEGVKHIGKLKNLTFVNLADTKLSDQGLERLANLENIEILVLDGTTVSDDGVSHFKRMRKLREVHLWKTNITETGVKAILGMLPETILHTDLTKP